MEIFDEVVDGKVEDYNELCQRNIQKKYRRGYSQFLAELIKYNIIDTDTFMKIINKIICQVTANLTVKESIKLNEEFGDCLMKIIKAIQAGLRLNEDVDSNIYMIRDNLKAIIGPTIKPFTVSTPENVGMSNKVRFTFLDIWEAIGKL